MRSTMAASKRMGSGAAGWTPPIARQGGSSLERSRPPSSSPPAPPQLERTIDVGAPITHIDCMFTYLLVATESSQAVLKGFDLEGNPLWKVEPFHGKPEVVETMLMPQEYTWIVSRPKHGREDDRAGFYGRMIKNKSGKVIDGNQNMTKAHYVIMPGCQTFASLDADGILSLNDYKNRILEKDLPFDKERYKVLGAFSAAEEGFFFVIEDTQGLCFMAGFDRGLFPIWENHVPIDKQQYGIPYQSLIDGENNQLFVSTELGCLFAIDIESGQKQDIPFSPPFNKSLDLELIATTLYAAGKERGSLYAFDALSHQLKWHFPQIGEISGYSLPTLFACSGDWHLLFGGANGKL